MFPSRVGLAVRKNLWRTKPPPTKTSHVVATHPNAQNGSAESPGMSVTMMVAGIFGSFIGIALLSRLLGPRRVEVVHREPHSVDYHGGEWPSSSPYRSI